MGQTKLFTLFHPINATEQVQLQDQYLIPNNHEPLSSFDTPVPELANFYKSDDHIYHYINNQWKRTPLSSFNS